MVTQSLLDGEHWSRVKSAVKTNVSITAPWWIIGKWDWLYCVLKRERLGEGRQLQTGLVPVFSRDRESKRNGVLFFFFSSCAWTKARKERKSSRPSFISLVSTTEALLDLNSDLRGPDFVELWNADVMLWLLCHCRQNWLIQLSRLGRERNLALLM